MLEELSFLIELQDIDSQLMDIDAEKGDLPEQIGKLNDEILRIKTDIESAEAELSSLSENKKEQTRLLEEAQGRLKKSQGTIFSVKTTREYDAISSEIDQSKSQMAEGDRIHTELESQEQAIQVSIEGNKERMTELETELDERTIEMKDRSETTEDVEIELKHEREKIVVRVKKTVYAHYERIKLIRDGIGVSRLSDGACSYCFSSIPHQRQAEIRRMDDLRLCEVCGCILISDTSD